MVYVRSLYLITTRFELDFELYGFRVFRVIHNINDLYDTGYRIRIKINYSTINKFNPNYCVSRLTQ